MQGIIIPGKGLAGLDGSANSVLDFFSYTWEGTVANDEIIVGGPIKKLLIHGSGNL